MNNLSSYCGLVDARISASDKDLPVLQDPMATLLPREKSFRIPMRYISIGVLRTDKPYLGLSLVPLKNYYGILERIWN